MQKVFVRRPSGRKGFSTKKQSVFARTAEILNELGIDRKQYENDRRLRELNKLQALNLPLQ